MTTFKGFKRTALMVMALICMNSAVGGDQTDLSRGILLYFPESSSRPGSILFKSHSGATYRLSLITELDVEKHVVVLELVLHALGKSNDDEPNLLDATGKLHGYQKYFFAASDFAHGARNSAYGESRTLDIRRLGMEMGVKIVNLNVAPIPTNSPNALRYQFVNLTLLITSKLT